MYKHKATHRESVITATTDDGSHVVFTPGKIITLNRVYKELECYGIICINPDEKKPVENKVPTVKKIKDKIMESD